MPSTPVAYSDAIARHPAAVAEIMKKLADGKSAHRGMTADQLSWSYAWAVQIGGAGNGGIHVALCGQAGRNWSKGSAIGTMAALPPEIGAVVNTPKPVVIEQEDDIVLSIVTNSSIERHRIIAAYSRKGASGKPQTMLVAQLIGGHLPREPQRDGFLYTIDGPEVFYAGGLHNSARDSLFAAQPGDTWRYRNKPMRRLTPGEIRTSFNPAQAYSFGGVAA